MREIELFFVLIGLVIGFAVSALLMFPLMKKSYIKGIEGMSFNEITTVQVDPIRATQAIVSGIAACSGYKMTYAGMGSIVLTRKYIPFWAVVVAILGFWFFLLGVLALLFKETGILTIIVSKEGSGSRIGISGLATDEMRSRLQMVLNDLSSYRPTSMP